MKLVPENHPILSVKTPLFDFEKPLVDLIPFTDEMFDLMNDEYAVGLAAPQIGFCVRLFVMRVQDNSRRICINPEIVATSDDKALEAEGCLSFPGLWLKVRRPIWVDAKFQDVGGNFVNERFENLAARCYLHETDHLDGVRFVERVGPLALMQARKRAAKQDRIK